MHKKKQIKQKHEHIHILNFQLDSQIFSVATQAYSNFLSLNDLINFVGFQHHCEENYPHLKLLFEGFEV